MLFFLCSRKNRSSERRVNSSDDNNIYKADKSALSKYCNLQQGIICNTILFYTFLKGLSRKIMQINGKC